MSNKWIKLIYDKYENEFYGDIGVLNTITNYEKKNVKFNGDYNVDRVFNIYTWGVKKTQGVDCDIIFDLRIFQTKVDTNVKINEINGFSKIIQDSIINHPRFDTILEKIINTIESRSQRNEVGCNRGKHRSVG